MPAADATHSRARSLITKQCHYAHVAGAAVRDVDRERECGVCLERTIERGERFGLLLGCTHEFWYVSHCFAGLFACLFACFFFAQMT